jgi:hypothetical protein
MLVDVVVDEGEVVCCKSCIRRSWEWGLVWVREKVR